MLMQRHYFQKTIYARTMSSVLEFYYVSRKSFHFIQAVIFSKLLQSVLLVYCLSRQLVRGQQCEKN